MITKKKTKRKCAGILGGRCYWRGFKQLQILTDASDKFWWISLSSAKIGTLLQSRHTTARSVGFQSASFSRGDAVRKRGGVGEVERCRINASKMEQQGRNRSMWTYFSDVASERCFVDNFNFVVRLTNDSKCDWRVVGDSTSNRWKWPWEKSTHKRA